MHDADAGRDDAKAVERLHSPLQELVARIVALEFHLHVLDEGVGGVGVINLNGVVYDQINGDERFD